MICNTGKPPSPLLKSFNQSTGAISTRSTGFNDSSWGEQTCGLVKLINRNLWPESYDKIISGAKDIAKKTCGAICAEEVIDLTADEPPEEFAMLVDIPSDDKDSEINFIKNSCVEHSTGLADNITKQVVNPGGHKYEYGDNDKDKDGEDEEEFY